MLQFWRSLLHSQNPSCQMCLFVHPKCGPDGTLYFEDFTSYVQIFIITLQAFVPESSLITEDMGVSYKEYNLWMYDLQPTVTNIPRTGPPGGTGGLQDDMMTYWRRPTSPNNIWPTVLLFFTVWTVSKLSVHAACQSLNTPAKLKAAPCCLIPKASLLSGGSRPSSR